MAWDHSKGKMTCVWIHPLRVQGFSNVRCGVSIFSTEIFVFLVDACFAGAWPLDCVRSLEKFPGKLDQLNRPRSSPTLLLFE